jgi:tRNA A-37 threonylcarbamoyl transferase component Bud32
MTGEAGCLGEETILGFIEGCLTSERLAAVELHARTCRSCQERLSAGFAAGAPAITATALGPLAHGTAVGRYTVRRLVGQGGMGEVYAAYDPKLDRTIALKLLRSHVAGGPAKGESRLMREAQAIARLSHPNVITVHDVGAHDDRVFLAMEYVEGQTLLAWLAERPRTRSQIVGAFREAARGLAAAHASGVVHRDFKPQNVMVGSDGAVRVTDFGLARRIDAGDAGEARPGTGIAASAHAVDVTLTKSGELIGTPLYMSPEQLRGEPTGARGDQFSFCVALYEALYGQHPFLGSRRGGREGDDKLGELIAALRAGTVLTPPARSGVPSWLRQILLRGLSMVPAQRWPSMDHMIVALARDPARPRRRVTLVASAAALVAAAAITGLMFPMRTPEAYRTPMPPAPAQEQATVTATIASAPGGARVVRESDGAILGVTPFRERWSSGAGVQRLRVDLDGYRPELLVVPLDRGIDLTLALKQAEVPQPPESRPPPRIAARQLRPKANGRPAADSDVDVANQLLRPAEERLGLARIAEGCALGRIAAERAPQSPAVWEFLGRCYMRMAEPDEARVYYRKYLALAPDGADASFIRAIVERAKP